jgi:plastocyanin
MPFWYPDGSMVWNRLFCFFLIAGFILVTGCAQQPQTPAPAPATTPTPALSAGGPVFEVKISNFSFQPAELKIPKGSIVIWANNDGATHTVTSDSGNEIASGQVRQGGTFSHTFNNTGTFDYHCSIHTTMKGKIIVEG